MRGCSGSVCQRALPAALARRRRTDDHRFILVGQALWAGIVPTWFISRASGDRPAQGFRGRPRLARLVADVFDLGAARTAPQDDFGPMADQHHGETLPRIRPYVASPSGTRGSHRDAAPAGLPLRRPACRTPPRPSRRRPPVQMIACVPPNQTGSAGWSEGHNNSAPLTKRKTSLRLLPLQWDYSPQLRTLITAMVPSSIIRGLRSQRACRKLSGRPARPRRPS